MKRISFVVGIISVLTLGLSSCTSAVISEPDHKAKTTACLIRSTISVPGTPENQLAADLVEAKIVYGLAAREVKIDDASEQVPTRLLQALTAGCVLMVSANPNYLEDLAQFALEHPRMVVLFVGGEISSETQPANFRWVADDLQSVARIAGFFAAGKSSTNKVHLFVQPVYSQAQQIRSSFILGVKDFDAIEGTQTQTVFVRTASSKTFSSNLTLLEPTDVAALFGGKSIWQSIDPEQEGLPFIIGADLQLGETGSPLEDKVKASVERNTAKHVFSAVLALLDREFASEPLYRKSGALKFNTVELRLTDPESLDGGLLESLNLYKQELLSRSN
jgi:hypothetical protein